MTEEQRRQIASRAYSAAVLIENPDFRGFVTEVREAQIAAFLKSGQADSAAREEAHAIIRALDKIAQALAEAVNSEKFAKHQEDQHRGND